MVILELCLCSLKTRIMSHPENAPARSEDAAVRTNVLLWVMQILDALCYVHDERFVHRDLKLDNLLVGKNFHFTLPLEKFCLPSTSQIITLSKKRFAILFCTDHNRSSHGEQPDLFYDIHAGR